MTREREVAREFDQWANTGRGEEMERGHGCATRKALDRVELTGRRFLDVGCGTGWTLDLAQQRGARFTAGTDLAGRMLRRGANAGRGELVRSSAARLPFADSAFDVVLSVEALYYTINLDAAVAEIHRVLKPGGRFLCVVDLYRESPACQAWVDALDVEVHALSIQQWLDTVLRAGFADAAANLLKDNAPITTEADFSPSKWYPTWDAYRGFKELGSLLLEGRRR